MRRAATGSIIPITPTSRRSSQTSEQPDNGPVLLEAYIGSFGGPSFGTWWNGQRLVYESYGGEYGDWRQLELSPSRAQWARFWRSVDELGVWEWRDRYEPGERFEPASIVRDGVHWSLTLRHAERHVQSSGDGAGPAARDLDESLAFDEFLAAVSRLLGGRPFA